MSDGQFILLMITMVIGFLLFSGTWAYTKGKSVVLYCVPLLFSAFAFYMVAILM